MLLSLLSSLFDLEIYRLFRSTTQCSSSRKLKSLLKPHYFQLLKNSALQLLKRLYHTWTCKISRNFFSLHDRFEVRNFKTQKWVSMFLSYLVENFFLVILRSRIFFVYEIFSKKLILRSNFRDFTRGARKSRPKEKPYLRSTTWSPTVIALQLFKWGRQNSFLHPL